MEAACISETFVTLPRCARGKLPKAELTSSSGNVGREWYFNLPKNFMT
jgi:hypothetical protein